MLTSQQLLYTVQESQSVGSQTSATGISREAA